MNTRHWSKKIPKKTSLLIAKMLDEDCLNPKGTAEKAAGQLLKIAIKTNRAEELKEAMKVWKGPRQLPVDVIWQWFNGVFEVKSRASSGKYQPKKGRRSGR